MNRVIKSMKPLQHRGDTHSHDTTRVVGWAVKCIS